MHMSTVYAYEKRCFWQNLSWPDWRRLCVDLKCIRTASFEGGFTYVFLPCESELIPRR